MYNKSGIIQNGGSDNDFDRQDDGPYVVEDEQGREAGNDGEDDG
jgi:hypothetical protein